MKQKSRAALAVFLVGLMGGAALGDHHLGAPRELRELSVVVPGSMRRAQRLSLWQYPDWRVGLRDRGGQSPLL